ncbi:MAG TPA: DinB family protein [Puia sp.]|jgi:hypothetical protein
MPEQKELFIKIALDAWNVYVDRAGKLFESLTDEQLREQVAPNRNTAVYLLGHLIAVHDGILPLLGFRDKLYPSLEEVFIKNPDRSGLEKPPIPVLRQYWKDVHNILAQHFDKLNTEEWLQKHNSISAEDFAREPHRNRLNVLVNRTNHLASHYGQLIFLKK